MKIKLHQNSKCKLFKHQKIALKRVLRYPYYGLFMDPGTGKTLVAIKLIEKLYQQYQINRVLITVPKSIIFNWEEELYRFLHTPYNLETLSANSADTRKKDLYGFYMDDITRLSTNELRKKIHYPNSYNRDELLIRLFPHLEILLVNYEKCRAMFDELRVYKPDILIVDESQKLRNRNAQVSKCIYNLSRSCCQRILMSGSPICNGYEDLFMQYKIMDEQYLGRDYRDFESRYITKGGYMNYEIKGYKNVEELQQIVYNTSYRIKIEDCIDLPEQLPTMKLYCELNSKSQKIYDSLDKEMIAQLELIKKNLSRHKLKEILKKHEIQYQSNESYLELITKASLILNTTSVDLLITKQLRLQQITGGFITMDSGESININRSKVEVLKDYLMDYKEPVVIFCNFIDEINLLVNEFKSKRIVATIQGSTKNKGKIVNQFQEGKIDMLILQISAGSVGLNLYKAARIIFYSWNYNYDDYIQAIGRIKRNGQKHKWQIIHIVVRNSIDEKILKIIETKQQLAEKVII